MTEPPPEAACRAWSIAQVVDFFHSCSLPQYADAVCEHCVDGQVFAELIRLNGLDDLGCESKLHQAKIMARLRTLSSESLPLAGCDVPTRPDPADVAGASAYMHGACRHGSGEKDLPRPELIGLLKDVVDVLQKSADASQGLEEFLHNSALESGGVRYVQRRSLVEAIVSGLSDQCRQPSPDFNPLATSGVLPTFEEFLQRSKSTDSDRRAESNVRHAMRQEICSLNGLRVTAGASFRRTSDFSGPETAVLCVDNPTSRNLTVRAVTSSLMSYIIAPANWTLSPGETQEVYITPVRQHSCEPYYLILEVASVQGEDVLDAELWSDLPASSIEKLVLRLASGFVEAVERVLLNSFEGAVAHPRTQPLILSKSAPILNGSTPYPQTERPNIAQSTLAGRGVSSSARFAESFCSPDAQHSSLPRQPRVDSAASCQSLHRLAAAVAPASLRAKLAVCGLAPRGVLGGSISVPVGSPVRHPGAHSLSGSVGAPVASVRQCGACGVGGSLSASLRTSARPHGAALALGVADGARQRGHVWLGSPAGEPLVAGVMSGVPAGSASAASWVVPSGTRQMSQAVALGSAARSENLEQSCGGVRPLRGVR